MQAWGAVAGATIAAALASSPATADAKENRAGAVRRGEYLVVYGGCNDCHTPWKMGPKGPSPDKTRLLSGHPQEMTMPPPPRPVGPWALSAGATMTAWAGPWGVSYAANLTPDAETGLGKWTEQNFIEALRKGRHMGRGRPILPPMPYEDVAALTDADLRAVFAYLRTIPAIRNRVPDPTPPEGVPAGAGDAAASPAPASGGTAPGR